MTNDDALRFDKTTFEAACVLEKASPLDLNECHFDQLAIISPAMADRAREAQRQAQLALVAANAVKPALQTKAAPAAKAPETTEEFLARYGKKYVTYQALFEAWDTLVAVVKTNKERVNTLEQINKELSARLLDLEASAAARPVQHAER